MARHLFIVGAQRSATTYLYQALAGHPQIEMNTPPNPEPKFFMHEGSENRVEEYLAKYFGRKQDALIRGEKSTSYIESRPSAERIAKVFPDALIVINMRNPVKRAVSNYWFTKSKGLEDQEIEVLMDERAQERDFGQISVSPFTYLQRGKYVEYVQMWADVFPRSQIRLIVQEQFVRNPDAISELFGWLGVDPSFIPETLGETINSAVYGAKSVPAQVQQFLQQYYEKPNKQLQSAFGVNVEAWS